jgi:hypothetical protein
VQGLITLCAAFAHRFRAGFVSRRQRSWDSPFEAFSPGYGRRCVSTRPNPLAVFHVGKRSARGGGPARRAAASGVFPVLGSLATAGRLTRRPPDASLGFSLPRCANHRLCRSFLRRPLLRFAAAGRFVPQPPALQSVCQRRPDPNR